jgi:hypothetical protein
MTQQLTLTLDTPTPKSDRPYIICTCIDMQKGIFTPYDPTQNFHSVLDPIAYWLPYGSVWREYHDLPWQYKPTGEIESKICRFGAEFEEAVSLLLAWREELIERDRILVASWRSTIA